MTKLTGEVLKPKKSRLASLSLTALALFAAACGGPASALAPAATQAPAAAEAPARPGPTVILPAINPADHAGSIIAAGSSTVFPLAERMADIFQQDGFAGSLTIDSIGTGAGFERFCVAGETDISIASRAIQASEREACQAIGREPVEYRVGTDALAVVVSAENDFLDRVTLEELAEIYSGDARSWADVNPAWPAAPIQRFSPSTDSGTFDYFIAAVLAPAYAEAGADTLLNAPNLQLSEDDNVLVQGVAGSPYAIGYFGYAYYQANRGKLKAIAVEGVNPAQESGGAGEYPLARPLFIYSDAKIMADKPQAAAFINYFLTYVGDEIRDVGYFPASGPALDTARQVWLDAMQ